MRTLAALAALLLPALAAAGPSLSLRLAWAPAVGDASADVPVAEALQAQVPVQQLDLLWRTGPLSAGAYGSYGVGGVADGSCTDGADCSGSALRAGVEASLAFRLGRVVAPWVGAGFGWEWATRRRERLGSETAWRWSGPEALVQGGVDLTIAEWLARRRGRVAIGPYALVAIGRYGRVALDTSRDSASAPLEARAYHAWFHLGVRATVDL